jgi:hypothetical protein
MWEKQFSCDSLYDQCDLINDITSFASPHVRRTIQTYYGSEFQYRVFQTTFN